MNVESVWLYGALIAFIAFETRSASLQTRLKDGLIPSLSYHGMLIAAALAWPLLLVIEFFLYLRKRFL